MCKKHYFASTFLMLLSILSFTIPSTATAAAQAKWTFMVYVDADNNLDPAGLDDINEMEVAGSTPDVNIIALLDRWDEKNVTGSWIYYIIHDENLTAIASPIVADLGEVNMGDPATLRSFVEFAFKNYPAERYALVLWDHGHGWPGVCDDWTDKDRLTLDEISEALSGYKLNLIGFDACLMSMIEVAYSLQNVANVMVASEEWEPWDGWPYDLILTSLIENPDWTEVELSTQIVDDYIESYKQGPYAYRPWGGLYSVLVTMAAINLPAIQELTQNLEALSRELINKMPEYLGAITEAKDSADRYWFGLYYQGPYIDLYHFVSMLAAVDKRLEPYTNPVLSTWSKVVIATKTYSRVHQNALGLTIYFPRLEWQFYYPEEYSQIKFSKETSWDEFLTLYFLYTAPPQKPKPL